MRILLVEDNKQLAQWIVRSLEASLYSVDCAHDGAVADHLLYTHRYALVILDLSLPRLDGREVLRRVRARRDNVPVLILTADNTREGLVHGLDMGADDYLVKPFDFAELEARMRALLRRSSGVKSPMVECGALRYDSNTREFTLHGTPVALSPRERALLETLVVNMGRTVSKSALAESLAGINEDVTGDAVDVYLHRVRRKLEGGPQIITLRGIGYLLRADDAG